MNGVLLNKRTGRPEKPEHLRDGFGRPEGARAGLVHQWINPELEVPTHIMDNLRRAAEDVHDVRAGMQGWEEVVYGLTTDGAAITNTVTETIMLPNFIWPNAGPQALYVGKQILITLWGRVSTVVTTPGTITFRLRWGGVAGTLIVTSKAQRPKTTVSTNMASRVIFEMTCRAIGSAGSVFSMGKCDLSNTIADAAAPGEETWPDAPTPTTIDTTAASALSPTIQFSVATATTAWTTHLARFEAMN